MAQAVGLLLFGTSAGLTVGGVALTTSVGALTTAGFVVNAGIGLALSALTRPDTSSPPPEDVVQTFQATTSPRQVHMGRAKVGGSRLGPPRSKDGKLYDLIAQMHGELGQRTKHFIDGNEVTLFQEPSPPYLTPADQFGGYVSQNRYQYNGRSMLFIRFRTGAIGETAYATLSNVFSDWTADHKATGLATALVVAETPSSDKFNGMFPNRTPQYSCEAEWHKVFDPRTNTTAHSENPIVHLRDFLTSPDGLGWPASKLNASFITAMNDCDVTMPWGARYRIGGTYTLIDKPQDVRDRILATCDGEMYQAADGTYGVRVGTAINPTVTLSADHVHSVLEWSNGNSLLQGYSSLKPKYTDQSLGFTSETIDTWTDDDLVTRYRQDIVGPSPDFTLVPHHTQARLLAKIKTKKDNPLYRSVIRYDLHGMKAIGEKFINIELDFAEFGVDYTGPAMVESITLAGGSKDRKDSLSYVDVAFSVLAADTYDFTSAEYGTAPTAPVSDTDEDFPPTVNLSAVGNGGGLLVNWDAPDRQDLSSRIEYSVAGSNAWQTVPVAPGLNFVQITGLVNGDAYDVQHAWISATDTIGPYTQALNKQASDTVNIPTPPTAFGATDISGAARINLVASSSAAIARTQIFRNSTLVYDEATTASQSVVFTDNVSIGKFRYTARSLNSSGQPSATVSATPTILTISP